MDLSNILLWTISLTLAVAGITFGIIASINATKANRQIKELVVDQLVAEEASKHFFEIPQSINTANKTVLRKLRGTKEILMNDYAIMATKTRMAPMSKRVAKHIGDSEYGDLAIHYVNSKVRLDSLFRESIIDYEMLSTASKINKSLRKQLIKYHVQVSIEQEAIMKEYYSLIKR